MLNEQPVVERTASSIVVWGRIALASALWGARPAARYCTMTSTFDRRHRSRHDGDSTFALAQRRHRLSVCRNRCIVHCRSHSRNAQKFGGWAWELAAVSDRQASPVERTMLGLAIDLVVHIRSPLLSRLMSVGRRALVFAAIAAAATGLAWASSERFEALASDPSGASVTLEQGSGDAGLAVIGATRSQVVRALTDSKSARAQLPWDLLTACGVTAIAVGLAWSRRHRWDRWCFAQDQLLRSAVPVRAPPVSRLA
jgi:hypothetical protein